ncbi:MAG TPA: hypothetical protein VF546_05645 [Pyrinomonadaceae bacterium]|jgi:hypothetical protein
MQNFPQPAQGFPPPPGGPPGGPFGGSAGAPPPAPKKSKTPWIIAGVGCLIIGGFVVLAIVGGLAAFVSKMKSTQTTDAPPARQAPGTKQYVNSRAGRTGDLALNYVDFSFYYPEDWQLVPNQTKNFVKVERDDEQGTTLENFTVGWISTPGTAFDKQLLPKLAKQLGAQLTTSFKDYEQVSEGETKVGPYEGYETRFTAELPGTPKGDATIYGRLVLLPPPAGQRKGVALLLLTTGLVPEITSVDDVGSKGDLAVILDSFRLGAK